MTIDIEHQLRDAGAAVRGDPTLPHAGAPDLGPARRRVGRHRAVALASAVAVVAAGLAFGAGGGNDARNVVADDTDAVVVPPAGPAPQLVPRSLPEGFTLRSWTEVPGGAGVHAAVDHFASGVSPASRPWLRLRINDPAPPFPRPPDVEVNRRGAVDGLAELVRQVPDGPGYRTVVIQGRDLTDDDLVRVADGLVVEAGVVREGWVPPGLHRVGERVPIDSHDEYGRALTYGNGTATFTLTTWSGGHTSVEAELWKRPEDEIGPFAGHDALISPNPPGVVSVGWIPRPGVLAQVQASIGVDSAALQSSVGDLVELTGPEFVHAAAAATFEPYSTGGGYPADASGPMLPVVRDQVAGAAFSAYAFHREGPRGQEICSAFRGVVGCGPSGRGDDVNRSSVMYESADGEAAMWMFLRDDVRGVLVHHLGQQPRLYTPVQPNPALPDRVMLVFQPADAPVVSIDLLDDGLRVLRHIDGPIHTDRSP